jgi:hypothetical protein
MKLFCILLLTTFVLGCGGYGSSSNNPGMGGGATTISQLVPNTSTHGDPAFTLTVNGTGFTSSSVVYWNGQTRPTTFVMANQLTAQISAADVANPATVPVYVRTTGGIYGGGTNSNTMNFTVN